MKLCEYANNLMKILLANSTIVGVKRIKSSANYASIVLYYVKISPSLIFIDEYLRVKPRINPKKYGYTYLNIFTSEKNLVLNMVDIKKERLEIDNKFILMAD
ncbi:MAG: hypothetical protein ACPL1B_09690 [Thermoprotei archaeon]|jgi:hypothetical protein